MREKIDFYNKRLKLIFKKWQTTLKNFKLKDNQ